MGMDSKVDISESLAIGVEEAFPLPTLDIIVLNFNNKNFIEPCLGSIKSNTSIPHKVIVIDQGSTDGSREWLIENKGTLVDELVLNEKNTGAWEGRNQGLIRGTADYVMFFDSDIVVNDPKWFEKLYELAQDKAVGLVEAKVKIWNGCFKFAGFASCLIKREVFQRIGLFDHHFLIGGDQDFWVRYMWSGFWRVHFCDETEIFHHCGRTIYHGCMKEDREANHKFYRQDMIEAIYSPRMTRETVGKLDKLRECEELKRGWIPT